MSEQTCRKACETVRDRLYEIIEEYERMWALNSDLKKDIEELTVFLDEAINDETTTPAEPSE